MTPFAERCGQHDAARVAACEALLKRVRDERMDSVRLVWCDLHGSLRGKTLMPGALADALQQGVSLVATLMLKDSADRTVLPVFDPGGAPAGFAGAANLVLLPDPARFTPLPWAAGSAWLPAQPWFGDARPVPQDSRRVLQQALAALAGAGYGLRCGLELEFHVYRIADERLDPATAAWPGEPPAVTMIHPGYRLLSDTWADLADPVLGLLRRTAQGLGLPLRSLEIEFGPSQFEAVFDPLDALAAADAVVAFRNGASQALRRAGYHASFMCLPPFPNVMASGWHLHQSLQRLDDGGNAFVDAHETLSPAGRHYLAGLLSHARAATAFATPTVNGYDRFRPHALAPTSVRWGRDNRGAMLRVLGGAGDPATRIENRTGEPAANPYLYIASQIHAGLDGLRRGLAPPPPTDDPYAEGGETLPASLTEALDALADDALLADAMGRDAVDLFVRTKRHEQARFEAADEAGAWHAREYFGRP
ncbi:MAG: glutamine synthetase family protein [Rubrivivax sp.]|nr:glutamine synthetase family protein [Rubrivivax sp.]